jgi:putative thioredoxin
VASTSPVTFDVSESDFATRVVERSRELPVIVDFWAEWCGPCRTLGPALEKAVEARNGAVELAKLDVDQNQSLSQAFGIQGIPAVKAFKDGTVAAEFTGAIPPAQIEAFIDGLVPSEADRLVEAGDEESLRAALAANSRHAAAATALARLLIERGDDAEALELLSGIEGDFVADGLKARVELSEGEPPEPIIEALAAWDRGEHSEALEKLQEAIAASEDSEQRDLLRKVMVGIFTELGTDDPLARAHRRRLALVLS